MTSRAGGQPPSVSWSASVPPENPARSRETEERLEDAVVEAGRVARGERIAARARRALSSPSEISLSSKRVVAEELPMSEFSNKYERLPLLDAMEFEVVGEVGETRIESTDLDAPAEEIGVEVGE